MHFCVVRRENVLFCDGVNPKEGCRSVAQPQATNPFFAALRQQRAKQKVQTRAMRGSAQSFIGKKSYLNLRLRAASDFFLRLTDGFS